MDGAAADPVPRLVGGACPRRDPVLELEGEGHPPLRVGHEQVVVALLVLVAREVEPVAVGALGPVADRDDVVGVDAGDGDDLPAGGPAARGDPLGRLEHERVGLGPAPALEPGRRGRVGGLGAREVREPGLVPPPQEGYERQQEYQEQQQAA